MRAIVCRRLGSLEDLTIEERDPLVPGGEVAMGELIDRRVSGKIVLVP